MTQLIQSPSMDLRTREERDAAMNQSLLDSVLIGIYEKVIALKLISLTKHDFVDGYSVICKE